MTEITETISMIPMPRVAVTLESWNEWKGLTIMKRFEVGKTYLVRSDCICGHLWERTVTRRTRKSVYIRDEYSGVESMKRFYETPEYESVLCDISARDEKP